MAADPKKYDFEYDATHTCMHAPEDGWDGVLYREKRNWWIWFWCFAAAGSLVALSWFWLFPDHEIPMTNQATTPAEFNQKVTDFVNKYDPNKTGVVEVPPGQDAYIEGRMWQWYPVLKLKAGQQYTIWLSSIDVTHSLIIGGLDLQFHQMTFDAVPGHMYGIKLTPMKPGNYLLYCSEYCGFGHQDMGGHLIVTP